MWGDKIKDCFKILCKFSCIAIAQVIDLLNLISYQGKPTDRQQQIIRRDEP
jgi:hypothetical protein